MNGSYLGRFFWLSKRASRGPRTGGRTAKIQKQTSGLLAFHQPRGIRAGSAARL